MISRNSLALCVFVVVLIMVEGAAKQFQRHHDGRRSILISKRANLKGLRRVPTVGFSPARFSPARFSLAHDDFMRSASFQRTHDHGLRGHRLSARGILETTQDERL